MTIILAIQKVEIERIIVSGHPRQKVCKTPSIKAGHGVTLLSLQLHGKHKEEDGGPGQPRHKHKPLTEDNQSKKASWNVAQVVEWLPSKYEALSSNPSTVIKINQEVSD
jgi:hypothetical protein